jgi:Actin-like ATPase involved in cell division
LIKKVLDTKISVDLLKKVVFARVEEIIELVFKDFNFRENINDSSNSILVLTGNGSKLFNKNIFHLDNKFNFKEISFYEESDLEICKAGVDLDSKWHNDETKLVSKTVKKKGFFENFFNFFGK